MFIWPCTIEIDSVPAPIATSAPSCMIWCDAIAIAWRPEEQKRLTVVAATVSGKPAASDATRATFMPDGPSGRPQPQMTSSISSQRSCRHLRQRALDRDRGHVIGPRGVQSTAKRFSERRASVGDDEGFAHEAISLVRNAGWVIRAGDTMRPAAVLEEHRAAPTCTKGLTHTGGNG